ncbi:copper chaperone PCu(A)C [Nocardiopsis sp. JB363]|uniref:copper chaperone PCu(A)C n=1 Tax=Nocardiopsis sp. JB363 TaxID=1434837 RepID=UPI00097AA924|nr:copper chaperone PCu(A)C [Nocardiopsis sp. JB363]SIO89851.1 Copper metallochaperone, bacterial analog of Cox17 protein [Nocardiopsis sp. JB363]
MNGHTFTGGRRAAALATASLFVVGLTACGAPDEVQAHGSEHDDRGQAEQEHIRITEAWIPEPANPEVGVLYLRAHNTSESDDPIVDVSTSASEDADLCSTETTESGAAQMRVVEEIPLPAGGSTELVDGGHHIMINDIDTPLEPGEEISVTLGFGSGAVVEFDVPVEPLGSGDGHHDTDHGHGGHH